MEKKKLKNALDTNPFTSIILAAPIVSNKDKLFTIFKAYGLSGVLKVLKEKRKEKKYYKKTILKTYYDLRDNTASFENMTDFADFLKQMEIMLFYNNSLSNRDNTPRVNIPEEDQKTILICDNKLQESTTQKKFRLLMEKENVEMVFIMHYSEYNEEVIDVSVSNKFASKVNTTFHIIDANTSFDNITYYNLLNNVNYILQNALADTFLTIYNRAKELLP